MAANKATRSDVHPAHRIRGWALRLRWRGVLMRVCAASVALVAIATVVCLDGLEYQPYFQTPYYQETCARLQTRAATNPVAWGTLAAGFGRAALTPTPHAAADDPGQGRFRAIPLAGYGGREGRPATGVHDDLWVKAVALRVGGQLGVLVGADALILPPEVTEMAVGRLGEELRLSRDQLYLSATHTHSSLGGWGEGIVAEAFAGEFQPGVREWFADRIVSAVKAAVGDLKPALFGQGHFAAPEFVRDRLVGKLGTVDPEFSYLVLRQAEGRLAVLGSYAAHATVLSDDVMEFSGDYPGYWQRAIEDATGGVALFLAGGVGSHSPVPKESGFAGAERMGKALAGGVLDRLPQMTLTNAVAFAMLGLDVALPPLHARLTDGVRLRPWAARRLLPVRPGTYVQGFRIGEGVWVSTPCDFSGELALGLKDYLHRRGYRLVITSFNGDYIGYVIPTRYYHLNGYEPRLMSFFGPGMADYLAELIRAVGNELTVLQPQEKH